MNVIGAKRVSEKVYLADPAEHPDAPSWDIRFTDAEIDRIAAISSDAIDRAQSLTRKQAAYEESGSEEDLAACVEDVARLQARVIKAFVGQDGYEAILSWMGGGEPIDPLENVSALGDVMAGFLGFFADRFGNERLLEVGAQYRRKAERVSRKQAEAGVGGKGKRKGKGKRGGK